MSEKKKKPNFFIIGHMKTGTTALYYYFMNHPEVKVPIIKELSYFAKEFLEERWRHKGQDFIDHFIKSEDEYLSYFEDSEEKKIWLDASPNYLFSEKAPKRIYDYNPDAKLLVLFREPVGFMQSLHSGMVFDLAETEEDFFKALDLEESRKKEGAFSYLYYKNLADYKKHLQGFVDVFPKNQIKVMFYEIVTGNYENAIKEITDYLDITEMPPIPFKKINANKKLRFGGLVKKIGRNPKIYLFIKNSISRSTFDKLFNIYAKLVYKNVPRKELPIEVINNLKKEQKDKVVEFEKYLKENELVNKNLDLIKLWGYDKL